MKKIVVTTLVLVMLMISNASAVVYLNNIPADIVVKQGEPVNIPFFVSSDKTRVEVYLLAAFKNYAMYYDGSNWVTIPPIMWQVYIKPAIKFVFLPEYIFGSFVAFDSADSDFELILCIDDILNGVFDIHAVDCGTRKVFVK